MKMKIPVVIITMCLLAGCATKRHPGDYRHKDPIELPPSAEALLLHHQHATHVADVQTLIFGRKNYAEFLVASITINLTRGDFAGWFHQTYVFEKEPDERDWSKAKLFCFHCTDELPHILPDELLNRPEKELRQYLRPAPIWR